MTPLKYVDFANVLWARDRFTLGAYVAERAPYRPPLIVLFLACVGAWSVVIGGLWLAWHSGEFAAWVMQR